MTQLFKISIDGVDKTKHVHNTSISRTINRFYDVATFTIDYRPDTMDIVKIESGIGVFDGFIYSCNRTGNYGEHDKKYDIQYRVECRTQGAFLTEPFVPSTEIAIDPAKTSHALCAYYANTFGIPIVITAIDLYFGGNYERTGTPLQALATIAAVTGAEYWWDGTSIRIEPNKPITSPGIEMKPTDVFNYIPNHDTIHNEGIGTIIVGAVTGSSTITTSIKCAHEVDPCSDRVVLRIVPHDTFDSAKGIAGITEIKDDLAYSQLVSSVQSITVDAQINKIHSITVDGARVSDYEFLYDTVTFSSPVRGRVNISYNALGYAGTIEEFMVEDERRYRIDVHYGDCDTYSADGVLSCNGDNRDGEKECGCSWIMTPKKMNYFAGFTFKSIGCIPTIYFTDGIHNYSGNVVTASISIARVDDAILSAYTGAPSEDHRRYKLRNTPVSIEEVKSLGIDVSYTQSGDYVLFDKHYESVKIGYTTAGHSHTVKFTHAVRADLTMVVNECEYEIGGENSLDSGSVPCTAGQRVPVDIVNELGCGINAARGRTVIVTDPNGIPVTKTVSSIGFIYIHNVIAGVYNINTSSIISNSWIKMTANV
jgi:hypothetical protein